MTRTVPKKTYRRSPDLMKVLSKNIKRLRDLKGISQEELAFEANVHRTFISMVERCERNITLSTVEMIAKALEVSVPTLLTEHDKDWDGK